jgi:hypothetical protein
MCLGLISLAVFPVYRPRWIRDRSKDDLGGRLTHGIEKLTCLIATI